MMYACINAAKDSHHTLSQQEMMAVGSPRRSQPHSGLHSTNMNILAPTVMMVSKHIDGSLNQWAVTFADKSAFTTVLTVSHKFRYCGHRFHLNDLACHSVLPLLLTSSHHNALLTPESDCQWDSDNKLSRLVDRSLMLQSYTMAGGGGEGQPQPTRPIWSQGLHLQVSLESRKSPNLRC